MIQPPLKSVLPFSPSTGQVLSKEATHFLSRPRQQLWVSRAQTVPQAPFVPRRQKEARRCTESSLPFSTQPPRGGPSCQQTDLIIFPSICLPLINNDIRSLGGKGRELSMRDLICYNQPLLACGVTQYE